MTAELLPKGQTIIGTLHRQRARNVEFTPEPAVLAGTIRRPARAARMLALAHYVQRMIDEGQISNRASVAARFRLTRARITQLLDLLLLAPDLQEAVLHLEAVDGVDPLSERSLRSVVHERAFSSQRTLWAALGSSRGSL